jgi:plastocyanin
MNRRTRLAREAAISAKEQRALHIRAAAFVAVIVVVLGAGVMLAGGDLFGQRGTTRGEDAIAVRASMAGFTPSGIEASVGQRVTIDFWTTDAAPHLVGGVHTFISDELGLHEELPAESRRTFTFVAPDEAGDYDVYCDTCCGGRESPSMHGIIRVRA